VWTRASAAQYSSAYQRYVTVLLLVIYLFNQIDRGIIVFLMEPIKHEFGLSDSALAFLAGPALLLFYTAFGIPVARLADRASRVNIISIAVALWSCMAMLSGAAAQFWQLALARIGVGVGEAGFSAVAQSLITSYHSAAERTRALSIFMLAIPLSGVGSGLIGGWINQAYGWRAAFILAGLPGIGLALLMKWTVREPARAPDPAALPGEKGWSPLRSVMAELWTQPAMRHLVIGMGLVNTACVCIASWTPTFLARNHGMSTAEIGTWLAVIGGVGGTAGISLGGFMASRPSLQSEQAKMRLIAFATVLMAPTVWVVLWCPLKLPALLVYLVAQLPMLFSYGPAFSLIQGLSAPNARATVTAAVILIQVSTASVGIQLVGFLSDVLTHVLGSNGAALRWSMTSTTLLALWATIHFWLASRTVFRSPSSPIRTAPAPLPVPSPARGSVRR
jgi:MFS family permease